MWTNTLCAKRDFQGLQTLNFALQSHWSIWTALSEPPNSQLNIAYRLPMKSIISVISVSVSTFHWSGIVNEQASFLPNDFLKPLKKKLSNSMEVHSMNSVNARLVLPIGSPADRKVICVWSPSMLMVSTPVLRRPEDRQLWPAGTFGFVR